MTLNKVEVIISKILRSPPWRSWPLWTICITNDHGYVPLVVNTSRFFPHSRLITGFVTRLNNSMFGDFVDRIYPIDPEIKDTTYTDMYASYLDLHPESDSEGRLRTKLYDKRDDFNFPIVNFPLICSNIPAGVFIS